MTVAVSSLSHGSGWRCGRQSQTVWVSAAGVAGVVAVLVGAVGDVRPDDDGLADCPEQPATLTVAMAAMAAIRARRTTERYVVSG